MKLGELALRLGLELRGDPDADINAPAPIEAAQPGMITFVSAPRYVGALRSSLASAVIVPAAMASEAKCAALLSDNPAYDFARVLEIFFPPYRPAPGIDPSAKVSPTARLGEEAFVGAYAVIGDDVTVGRRAAIHPHVTIYPEVQIGDDFTCHSHASIREKVVIGNRVTILSGAVIGADGFGFIEQAGALVKIPQVGTVIVEDDVEIGANSTVDRATMGATVLRRGVKLDNLVHIGHNCEVGAFSRLAAQAGLAGSVRLGEWCQFGGQTGCADHAQIGARVRVVAQSGIPHDLPDDSLVGGTPACDILAWRRASALHPRLPEMMRRIRALERRLGADKP